MKYKIMTWDEFMAMCKTDAENWYHSGYRYNEITADDILNEYDESFFSDSTDDDHDDLSSCFTPDDVAQKTLDYLKKMEV